MRIRQIIALLCFMTLIVIASIYGYQHWKRPKPIRLTLATGQKGGTYYPLGKLIATAANQADSRLSIDVIESAGSGENMERLFDGTADLAILQNDTIPSGSVRTLMPLHRGVFHFVAHREANVESVADLKGKRVAVGPRDSGTLKVVSKLLGHFGISFDEFTPVYEGVATASDKLINHEIDALLFMAAVDAVAARKIVEQGTVRYVSLAEDANDVGIEVDGFVIAYPYVEKYIIPRHLHPLQDDSPGEPQEACASFSLRSSLVSRADLPHGVARNIVKGVVENRAAMIRENQAAVDITENFGHRDVHFTLHPGAKSFFDRTEPGFLERYAEPMAFALSLLLALCALGAGVSKWLVRSKKNRIDVYYSRLDVLLTEINEHDPGLERLAEIEREVMDMRREAVRELVDERLLADESFQIFQSLLTDCHRQIGIHRRELMVGE